MAGRRVKSSSIVVLQMSRWNGREPSALVGKSAGSALSFKRCVTYAKGPVKGPAESPEVL